MKPNPQIADKRRTAGGHAAPWLLDRRQSEIINGQLRRRRRAIYLAAAVFALLHCHGSCQRDDTLSAWRIKEAAEGRAPQPYEFMKEALAAQDESTKTSVAAGAVDPQDATSTSSDLQCISVVPMRDLSLLRVVGFFKPQDRQDVVYFYQVTLSKADNEKANLPSRRELYIVGALYDIRIGIPELIQRGMGDNFDGEHFKRTQLQASFFDNKYIDSSEFELFRRALPKYREWVATADKLRPASFQKRIPVTTDEGREVAEFRWALDESGAQTASMIFYSSLVDEDRMAQFRSPRRIDGASKQGFSSYEVDLLDEALKMSDRAKAHLEKEMDKAFEEEREKMQLLEDNFN